MPQPQALLELDDDVTTDHIHCPFCTGELVVRSGVVSHSVPDCASFSKLPGHELIERAREEERRRICRPKGA